MSESALHQWLAKVELKNDYFILRHGESLANVDNLIVSAPDNGVIEYGLSEKGQQQVQDSLQGEKRLGPETLIVCSDFRRTVETAAIAAESLSVTLPPRKERLLRERFFGELELKNSAHYKAVWVLDKSNAAHTEYGVESVLHVLQRLQSLLVRLEDEHMSRDILLISHGDILQILQTAFDSVEPAKHRSIPHLNTAELRHLSLS